MKQDAIDSLNIAAKACHLRLFLDYDGTLADFAPAPDVLLPDMELISLMKRLVNSKGILPAIISGRKLQHIEKLLPVQGLMLAGTYGLEIKLPNDQYWSALDYQQIRPIIERIFPLWNKLVENNANFHLEDKGWSIALHGRFASDTEVDKVMSTAHQLVEDLQPDARFRFFEGDRFLEYAPLAASKKTAAKWILDCQTPKDAIAVYIGDDDKDEDAFDIAIKSGGYAVLVSESARQTRAQVCLKNPTETRFWLNKLISLRCA